MGLVVDIAPFPSGRRWRSAPDEGLEVTSRETYIGA